MEGCPRKNSRINYAFQPCVSEMLRLLLAILIASPVSAMPSTCYLPDGSVSQDYPSVPCDPSTAISSCCVPGDYCLSNGLCLKSSVNNLLAVSGCTDRNWVEPCNKYCVNKSGNFTQFQHEQGSIYTRCRGFSLHCSRS